MCNLACRRDPEPLSSPLASWLFEFWVELWDGGVVAEGAATGLIADGGGGGIEETGFAGKPAGGGGRVELEGLGGETSGLAAFFPFGSFAPDDPPVFELDPVFGGIGSAGEGCCRSIGYRGDG